MASTYELIQSYEVGAGGAAAISFSSIPATYTDLCLKISARSTRNFGVSYDAMSLQFNGSTSTYSTRMVYGDGSGAASATSSLTNKTDWVYGDSALATSTTFGSAEIYIPNYTSTSYAKSISADSVSENNATQAISALTALLWNPSTQAAISSIIINFDGSGANFVQYSTAYLYGVKNA